ncbi:hypothetical protein [Nocardia sp. NBC_01009]|uniref:hypothetical protein n=1 Tax=Nocardia sp. NBC_01009 TaxID=2975996 RepID=UPI0038664ABD|nr:hypothetical protein OHA42_18965 [Nocardia sp. NBC_01009]
MRKTITACAFIAATTVAMATAAAQPAPDQATVGYSATTTETGIVISTDAGSLAAEDGVFTVQAADGRVLAGTELSFRVDDFLFPIEAAISGQTATLTPKFDAAHANYQPVALPFESQAPWKTEYEREQAAWNRMATTMQMGGTIGTAVGAIGGAAVGCLLGGIAGATIASAAIIGLFGAFIPAAAIGCIGGMLAIGPLGTIAGALLISAPIAIMAAAQYFTTINQPSPNPAK